MNAEEFDNVLTDVSKHFSKPGDIALAAALTDGVIAGAALDVFEVEPLPAESPLRQAPNLILTPHAAWYSEAAIGRLQQLIADDIGAALSGARPRRPVPGSA